MIEYTFFYSNRNMNYKMNHMNYNLVDLTFTQMNTLTFGNMVYLNT